MNRLLLALMVAASVGLPIHAADPAKVPNRTAMYEDIEVFRRLLAKSFQGQAMQNLLYHSIYSHHPNSEALWYDSSDVRSISTFYDPRIFNSLGHATVQDRFVSQSQDWPTAIAINDSTSTPFVPKTYAYRFVPAAPEASIVEGAYVKDIGVVYHVGLSHARVSQIAPPVKAVTLKSNCAHCHTDVDSKALVPQPIPTKAAPLDPWEAELKVLRGVKETPPTPAPATRVAKNDICVPGLISEELLTSLTLYASRFRDLKPEEKWVIVVTVQPAPPAPSDPATDRSKLWRSRYDELSALAGLHEKQGKNDQAIRTYQQVVEFLATPLQVPATTPYETTEAMLRDVNSAIRQTYGKLAQMLLAANRLDEAKEAIEKAKISTVKIAPTPAPKEAKPNVPTKLTLTLKKQLIDDHKAGKLTLDELRRAADIEAIGFATRAPAKK